MTDNLPVAYVNPDGRPHFAAAQAQLREADTAGRIDLAAVLVRMLTPAGAISQWDSGTIEEVLTQTHATLDAVDIPWVGSTGDEIDSHAYWANIADDLGWEHDYEPENKDEDEDGTDA